MALEHDIVLTEVQQRVSAAIAAGLADRLVTMGQTESGLFNYYARKLRHDALLSEYDLHVLRILRERVGEFRRVWEIGPGTGQLTAMLALDGHHVIAIDHDTRRYGAMMEMLGILERFDPAARARVSTRREAFPKTLGKSDNVGTDVVLALNCGFTAPESGYRAFEDALPRFGFGLIDFALLFTEAQSPEEWRQRARAFSERHGILASAVASYQISEVAKQGELFLCRRATPVPDGTN
ncbi:MAG: hypothetical protein Q8K93_25765 [Reyranella sp.]|uniref:hypothetical protein n=1 Tax=Reyranella sp. TaxID=1929291 RepID=UPI00272FDBE6|nr:hypothetical protein [Reyranella sp.]MDP1965602.1 hypothetical protein [Reyranella sp.]MDP2377503.1 hypothetical protein [Reyranella sp.]